MIHGGVTAPLMYVKTVYSWHKPVNSPQTVVVYSTTISSNWTRDQQGVFKTMNRF